MELKPFKITITRLELTKDNEDFPMFKAKGYQCYKTLSAKGKRMSAFNHFTSVRLYPKTEEQIEETKNRLWNQKVAKPKISIVAEKMELITPIIGGKICPILTVTNYDFDKDKLFSKRKGRAKKGETENV